MESVLLPEAQQPQEVPETPEMPVAMAEEPVKRLFEWSGYVHVGDGASACPNREPGDESVECVEPGHFHAWVCLPNALQHRDIGDKARAARARKIRALRDAGNPEKEVEASDSYVVLEAELEAIGEADRGRLAAQMAETVVGKEISLILSEVSDDDRFEHRQQDMEELARQRVLPEDQRDPEVVEQLERNAKDFEDAFQAEVKRRRESEITGFMALEWEQFIDLIRQQRIEEQGTTAYLNTYYTWIMFIGARRTHAAHKRKYEALSDLKMAAPEIVAALRAKVDELENKLTTGGGRGN